MSKIREIINGNSEFDEAINDRDFEASRPHQDNLCALDVLADEIHKLTEAVKALDPNNKRL